MHRGRIGHVLLVEHEVSARQSTGRFLERAGFAVLHVSSVEEAIGCLNGGDRPAMVLCDNEPPIVDGLALLRTIDKHWGFIPVVLYGRSMTPQLRAHLIAQGADVCFDKPVNIEALVAFLRKRTGRLRSDRKSWGISEAA